MAILYTDEITNTLTLEIVNREDISGTYLMRQMSCMRGEKAARTKFYDTIKGCRLLRIFTTKNGHKELAFRCLLWRTDSRKVMMDKYYEEDYENNRRTIDYEAKKFLSNNWKDYADYNVNVNQREIINFKIKVPLQPKKIDITQYPYLDTWKYLDNKKNILIFEKNEAHQVRIRDH